GKTGTGSDNKRECGIEEGIHNCPYYYGLTSLRKDANNRKQFVYILLSNHSNKNPLHYQTA
ncbi:MAG: hypothetical protein ACRC3K_05185, partial [Plesiomonas sp.]